MGGDDYEGRGRVYTLRLEGGKYYVGWTTKGMERVTQHIEEKGANWTRKYPPVEVIEFSERGKTTTDEDNKTLEMMQKYGIENVRGGIWCELQFEDRVLRNLKGQVAHYSPDKGSEKRRKPKRSKHFADPEISAKRVESIEKLKKRGVFYVGKNRKYKGVKRCYSKIKEDFEKGNKWATKWYPILSSLKSKGNKSSFGLGPLYPVDHWMHEPSKFDSKLSKEFEEEGFRWNDYAGGYKV